MADFWNGTLFRGIHLLRSQFFARQDREYHKGQHKEGTTGVRRDVLMRYRDEGTFLLGIELMDTIDYSIPVRIVDYDVQELMRQVKDISSTNRQAVKNGLERKNLRKSDMQKRETSYISLGSLVS